MSLHFVRQIDKLKKKILSLGARVEEHLQEAVASVETRSIDLAEKVIAEDDEIDQLELDVEEECLQTLALHQPVAFDLRYVVAVLKMNNDMERIADLSVNIAEQAIFLAQSHSVTHWPDELRQMARRTQSMLRRCLDALVNIDADLAQAVRNTDDEVDLMHRQMYELLESNIRSNAPGTERLIHCLSVSRYLERIADHTVNIAEDVIYMAKGKILRHRRPHPLAVDKAAAGQPAPSP